VDGEKHELWKLVLGHEIEKEIAVRSLKHGLYRRLPVAAVVLRHH
jgi:hypothetical protein